MFYFNKIVPLFFSPIFFIFFASILLMFTRSRLIRIILLAFIYFLTCPAIGNLAIKYLEKDYKYISISQIQDANSAIVLSGMIRSINLKNRKTFYEFTEGVDRFEASIQLFHQGKVKKIFFTRGNLPWSIGLPEGEVLKKLAQQRGVPAQNIFLTKIARNTEEEVAAIKKLIAPNEKMILITSAFHMPRAIKLFNFYNLQVVPFPVDFRQENNKLNILNFLPSVNALSKNSLFVREIIGRLYYTIKYHKFL